jgi:hypothetical protein
MKVDTLAVGERANLKQVQNGLFGVVKRARARAKWYQEIADLCEKQIQEIGRILDSEEVPDAR